MNKAIGNEKKTKNKRKCDQNTGTHRVEEEEEEEDDEEEEEEENGKWNFFLFFFTEGGGGADHPQWRCCSQWSRATTITIDYYTRSICIYSFSRSPSIPRLSRSFLSFFLRFVRWVSLPVVWLSLLVIFVEMISLFFFFIRSLSLSLSLSLSFFLSFFQRARFDRVWPSFVQATGLDQNLLGFTGFFWVLPSFTWYYWVFPGFY